MIDLESVAAELEHARLARLNAEAAVADVEEMIEEMHRAAYQQVRVAQARERHEMPASDLLRLAS